MNQWNKVKIRNGRPSDHQKIVTVMPEWWGGRDLSASVLPIFFIHFGNTTYVAEIENQMVGFLVGFLSQSEEKVGCIHFAGVHPGCRKSGIGRLLFQQFYEMCRGCGRAIVQSCTSPKNTLSIDFHQKMGFVIEPGDGVIDGVPVMLHYFGQDHPIVRFRKELSAS